MSKYYQRKVCAFILSFFLAILIPFYSVSAEGMVVDWVKINQPVSFDEVEAKPVPTGFEYDFSSKLDSSWQLNQWSHSRTLGYIYCKYSGIGTPGCYRYLDARPDDMILEAKMKFPRWGECSGISLEFGNKSFQVRVYKDDIFINSTHGSYAGDEIDLSNSSKWYNIKVETYDCMNRARVYVEGKCAVDVELPLGGSDRKMIQFFTSSTYGADAEMQVDWVKYTPIMYANDIQVLAEEKDGDVHLSSQMTDGSMPDSVEYCLYGKQVATGYYPDYSAVLSGLHSGKYRVLARAGEKISSEIEVNVPLKISAKLNLDAESNLLSMSLVEVTDPEKQIANVSYFIDGEFVGKTDQPPYKILSTYLLAGHTITAILKDKNGLVLKEIRQNWQPELRNGDISQNYANEISYTISGKSGDATVKFGNGTHLVHLVHSDDRVKYKTIDGVQTYSVGMGAFKILTDGPFAEVYCNGQLAFSFLLPKDGTPQNNLSENGLKIEDFSAVIPTERENYFVKRNLSGEALYELSCTDAWNNLDFVVSDTTDAELVFADGYYLTKLSLENGKIYAQTVFEEKSPAEKREVATMPEGSVFYRAEMGGGMIRLYADGKWLASFRGVLTTGKPELGVRVTNGGIDYLAVNDCADVYLYEDAFDESGVASGYDYWKLTDVKATLNQNTGVMTLDADRCEVGFAELNAFAGDVMLSTDVTLTRCDGGFWFLVGHGIEEEYARVGYNATTGRFEVVVAKGDDKSITTTTLYETEGVLQLNRQIKLSLEVKSIEKGKEISVMADGKKVLSYYEEDYDSPALHRGKVGFVLSKCIADLNKVNYRGDAKPLLSVNGNNALALNSSTFDVIENEDGLVLVGVGTYLYSKNAGKSWRGKGASELQGCDIVQLANGKYLSVKLVRDGDNVSFISAISDDGLNYTRIGTVSGPSLPVTTTGNRVYQGESGKIYFVRANPDCEREGSLTILCSVDDGVNWSEWVTFTSEDVGGAIHEAKLIELQEGDCRMYFRSEYGTVVSLDYDAQTDCWTTEPQMLPMFASTNCFNVDQDLSQRNILYMGWSYDNANLGGQHQYPRSRWAIAKSDDYGESWTYIGTTMEYTREESTVQNMNINVTDDYIIHNANGIADSSNIDYGGRYFVLDRNKQVATQRFEQLHLRYPTQMEEQAVVSSEQKKENLVVNTTNNKVLYSDLVLADMSDSVGILLDFNSGDFAPDQNFMKTNELSFDSSNGLSLNGGYLRYVPMDFYKPIIPGERFVRFTAKVEEGQNVHILFQDPEGGNGRASFVVTPDGVSKQYGTSQTVTTDFAPGNKWVDYLLVADTDAINAASLYAKVDGAWKKVVQVQGYHQSGGDGTGIYFTGTGSVRDAVIYGDDGIGSRTAVENQGGAEMLKGVSPYLLAEMIGAVPEVQVDGYISLRMVDREESFPILTREEKTYLDLHDFAETYGMNFICENDLVIVGRSIDWSSRALRAMKLSTEPFADVD